MIVNINEDLKQLNNLDLLENLLKDKTTGNNIIWASDLYEDLGDKYKKENVITSSLIVNEEIINSRFNKETEEQISRTRKHAEVYSPLWVCSKMNDILDEDWNNNKNKISSSSFPYLSLVAQNNKDWTDYINSRRLEITCGEAPYIISRYDSITGEFIEVPDRIGLLDKKLKLITENTDKEEDWLEWTFRAFESIYGYEMLGDSLLIARVNLVKTFEEYLDYYWKRKPTQEEYKRLIEIIINNFWQMDGLTGLPPYKEKLNESKQVSFFGSLINQDELNNKSDYCEVYNWKDKKIETVKGNNKMKFDYIIGNPPYQEEVENNKRMKPIYNFFMDEVYKLGDKVELITPARFLFNAGQTPRAWNNKMLKDNHFKVLYYESNSNNIFNNVDIKGGVVITYHDKKKKFKPIKTFIPYPELDSIVNKISKVSNKFLDEDISNRGLYRFTETITEVIKDFNNRNSKGTGNMLGSDIFDRFPELFHKNIDKNKSNFIQIVGRKKGKREFYYINKEYVINNPFLNSFNVIIPKANGTGAFGETLASPFIIEPNVGTTDTFMSIGLLKTEKEAQSLLKYIKTKFVRALLSVLKITHNQTKAVWKLVPIQDFTENSDIDWTKSISEIDQQLYQKYGLNDEEIEFIETHVKEMK